LIRWIRPDGSVPPASQFIEVAEGTELISEISRYIFKMLVDGMALLRHTKFVPVSFNVPARDFEDQCLVRLILASLARQ
jgi:EAL domain-containing protein (putative c-di-GMP-specific phosphodiesterase class I)